LIFSCHDTPAHYLLPSESKTSGKAGGLKM
jgi:hypothetical protein